MAPISRIIRFLARDGRVLYGEQPLGPSRLVTVLSGNLFDGTLKRTSEKVEVVEVLAPLVPTDLFAVGINYLKHYMESAKKQGIPLPEKPALFMKPSGTVTGPTQEIIIPDIEHNESLDWEVELAVIIGKKCKNVTKEQALSHVFGYTIANDITVRYWQMNAGAMQWTKGKGFDTFAPLGPCIVTKDEIKDPQILQLICRVNDEVQQNSRTDDMIFSVAEIIEWLSKEMSLMPGAVILTGTPEGVAIGRNPPNFLKEGDVVECEIPEIGVITNKVKSRTAKF